MEITSKITLIMRQRPRVYLTIDKRQQCKVSYSAAAQVDVWLRRGDRVRVDGSIMDDVLVADALEFICTKAERIERSKRARFGFFVD